MKRGEIFTSKNQKVFRGRGLRQEQPGELTLTAECPQTSYLDLSGRVPAKIGKGGKEWEKGREREGKKRKGKMGSCVPLETETWLRH